VSIGRDFARVVILCTVLMLAGAALAVADPAGYAADFRRNDLDGRPVRLTDYRGRVVLLDFWATWCEPCLEEIPTFIRWQKQYGPAGLTVIGISMDDTAQPVRRFLKKNPTGYPVVVGDVELARLYGGVLGLPLTFLIDARGRVAGRYAGETSLKAIEARIRELLPH
jgi:thiol-disulfide isomerase/thioredoxin